MNSEFLEFRELYLQDLLRIRRHIHQFPELSWEEYQTTDFIEKELHAIGITDTQRLLKTGIVATINGSIKSEKCIALRADIDALPIQEQNSCDYKSVHEGRMHACGHDVHTTCLLGAANHLYKTRADWGGTIVLIFQPSEEKQPSGAEAMIEAGVLSNPKVQSIVGLHVTPELSVGKMGYRKGQFMASADEIYITIIGKGGHAASPHLCIDPILIAAHFLVAAQSLISRVGDPKIPSVLSFGDIQGHGATNIIPDKVTLKGTLRTFDENQRNLLQTKLKTLCTQLVASMGGTCEIDIPKGLPSVYNDEIFTDEIVEKLAKTFGPENIIEMPLRMGAEDFSYYGLVCKATFLRLGTGSQKAGTTIPVHNSQFNIDEDALIYGMMAFIKSAL